MLEGKSAKRGKVMGMGKIISKRDKVITVEVLAGGTYAAVGEKNGISSDRVGQIVRHIVRRFARDFYDRSFSDSGSFDIGALRENSAEIIKRIQQG